MISYTRENFVIVENEEEKKLEQLKWKLIFLEGLPWLDETATPSHTHSKVAGTYGKITCKHTREIHPFQLQKIT